MTRTAHGTPLREEITKWECSSASDVKGKDPVSAGSFLIEKKNRLFNGSKRGKYEKIYQKSVVVFDGFMILEICEQVVNKE